MKAGVADGAITAEGQVHGVGAALDALGQLAVLEAADKRAVAVRPVVDVDEVVVGFDAEAGEQTDRRQKMDGGRG